MSLTKQTSSNWHPGQQSKQTCYKTNNYKNGIDFCKIGGLENHLTKLRETIIFPLLHGNVFAHFKIKAPRGVLFYGPPGTGKTLVAAALANEIKKEGIRQVNFFARKGADVLDKWVGGSEKNLRDLFEKASKCKPSIIFFDELDGLAPVRDQQSDQIHSSVVTTLLALMDGLDNKPGVIVIGATNRIESIDPALRRPGRFDKELYFPLPGTVARREILEVHTASWKHKPTPELLTNLVEVTSGFSGADLQALCSEAIIQCLKRLYPSLPNAKIDPNKLRAEECDFLNARIDMVPSTQKSGMKMRKLAPIIEPLLNRQLKKFINSIETFWPHFLQEDYKYVIGKERYAGRVLLIGSKAQGVYNHLIPAILQQLEYLPSFIYDITNIFKKNGLTQVHHPSVILLYRVDEWWNIISETEQMSIQSTLEDIHAGLPTLVIATCKTDVPFMLQNFFYNHSNISLRIEDPDEDERKEFLRPLFLDPEIPSLTSVFENNKRNNLSNKQYDTRKRTKELLLNNGKRKREPSRSLRKRQRVNPLVEPSKYGTVYSQCGIQTDIKCEPKFNRCDSYSSLGKINGGNKHDYFDKILATLLNQPNLNYDSGKKNTLKAFLFDKKFEPDVKKIRDSTVNNDVEMQQITFLWEQASLQTSRGMSVSQLEFLYDVISACISIYWNSFVTLLKKLEDALKMIEFSNSLEG
ncbi:hypothetical protein ABEB36_002318 [Hypothenemus hampei]|uniref:AAA+ ATPase domain-containing protein n=1 Tax=Hypothenemus hampei TaxID=57062 RepID=A0ABD1F5Q0_HYPHA